MNSLIRDLEEACIQVFRKHGIEIDKIKLPALFSIAQIRNAQIRQEWNDRDKDDKEFKEKLARKYGFANKDDLNKILYERNN